MKVAAGTASQQGSFLCVLLLLVITEALVTTVPCGGAIFRHPCGPLSRAQPGVHRAAQRNAADLGRGWFVSH